MATHAPLTNTQVLAETDPLVLLREVILRSGSHQAELADLHNWLLDPLVRVQSAYAGSRALITNLQRKVVNQRKRIKTLEADDSRMDDQGDTIQRLVHLGAELAAHSADTKNARSVVRRWNTYLRKIKESR